MLINVEIRTIIGVIKSIKKLEKIRIPERNFR